MKKSEPRYRIVCDTKEYLPKKVREMVDEIVIEQDFDYCKNRSFQHYFVYLKNGTSFDATSVKDLKVKAKKILLMEGK